MPLVGFATPVPHCNFNLIQFLPLYKGDFTICPLTVICTRYGIRIRVAGMKILSPRPLDEPSVLFTDANIQLLSDICKIFF